MKMPITATYGHGTENDFLLIFDPGQEILLTEEIVRNLCNRSTPSCFLLSARVEQFISSSCLRLHRRNEVLQAGQGENAG